MPISLASVTMVVAAIVLVTILFCTNNLQYSATIKGLYAAVGASFIFGSTGVPMKFPPSNPKRSVITIDPVLFAVWTSAGIFLASCPLMLYLQVGFRERFVFKPWAIIGSVDVVAISYLTFHAVQLLGYARAPAIWAR